MLFIELDFFMLVTELIISPAWSWFFNTKEYWCEQVHFVQVFMLILSPWYDHIGLLGIKHQLFYWLN